MKNTSLCYIEQDDKYFLLHRTKKEKDINKGKWIGFGGKFLENESPEECVRREVQEETGLILDTLFYRGIVTFVMAERENICICSPPMPFMAHRSPAMRVKQRGSKNRIFSHCRFGKGIAFF